MRRFMQQRICRSLMGMIVLPLALVFVPQITRAECEDDSAMEVVCSETTLDLEYGDHTSGCAISPSADIDTFEFSGEAGDPVRVICSGLSDDFGCRIEIWTLDLTKIADESCTTVSTCSVTADVVLPATGTYFMAISEDGNDQSGNYSLNLEKLPPDNAQELIYDTTEECRIDPVSDVDKFAFGAAAGSSIRIVMGGMTDDFGASFEVWDPVGNLVASEFCDTVNTCSISSDIPINIGGTHYVAVSDHNYDLTGNYLLEVNCLVGDCEHEVPCTDNDDDGYGSPASTLCDHPQWDCDDENGDVNPGMPEIPGNGIDDDCNGGTPACWPCDPASTVGANHVESSDVVNYLFLLMVPLGAVIFLRLRKK